MITFAFGIKRKHASANGTFTDIFGIKGLGKFVARFYPFSVPNCSIIFEIIRSLMFLAMNYPSHTYYI